MDWYYSKKGAQQGPVSLDELRQLLAQGDIVAADLVWHEGMGDWTAAGEVAELREGGGAQTMTSEPTAASAGSVNYSPNMGSPVVVQPRSGMAIASMICGILALITFCIWCVSVPLGLIAVVLGHIAKSNARKNPAAYGGGGMALTGLVTGYLGLVLAVVVVIFFSRATEDTWMNMLPEDVRQQIQSEQRQRIEGDIAEPEVDEMTQPSE